MLMYKCDCCYDMWLNGKYLGHDDVIKWKHFPRYWPFVRRIHRSPVNSPHKGQWRRAFDVFLDPHPNKRLSKQWGGWWFETPSCPLWRHRNVKTKPCHACLVYIYIKMVIKCIWHNLAQQVWNKSIPMTKQNNDAERILKYLDELVNI